MKNIELPKQIKKCEIRKNENNEEILWTWLINDNNEDAYVLIDSNDRNLIIESLKEWNVSPEENLVNFLQQSFNDKTLN